MSDSYVFISYSHKDRPFVDQLTAKLREAGVRTWTDIDNIRAGQEWARQIDRGLLGAAALIYVSSRNSSRSPWMDKEYAAFRGRGSRVIPIVIDDEGPDNLPEPLRALQWADFRGPFEQALHSLLDGIGDLQGSSPLAAPKPKSKGYVFISYANEDAEFSAELKIFMRDHGYGYWDYGESRRDYQSDYTLELEGIIKNAAGTLSVVSPDWKRSHTALQELHFSREVGTPVFLLKLKDPGPTLTISGLTYIDFTQKRSAGFAQLESEMRREGL